MRKSVQAAKPGRKPEMTAKEKTQLKKDLMVLLQQMQTLQVARVEAEAGLAKVAEQIHEKIGGVSFRFGKEMYQIKKKILKDSDGNSVGASFKLQALAEKRVLDLG
jgi:rubrerythrin